MARRTDSEIRIRLDPGTKRALADRAHGLGCSMQSIVAEAVEHALLDGGRAPRIRVALLDAKLVELEPGREAALDLELGGVLRAISGAAVRDQVAELARVLLASPAVIEVYGTEPDLRRCLRLALAG